MIRASSERDRHLVRAGGTKLGRLSPVAWLLALGMAAACGGDGTTDPPVPPPPPPPPPPGPAVNLSLALGELRILRDADEVQAFQLNGASDQRGYLVAVSSGSQATGATPMRLRVVPASGASGDVTKSGPIPRPNFAFSEELQSLRATAAGESRLKRAMRQELERAGRPLVKAGRRVGPPSAGLSIGATQAVPQIGDTIRFKLAVQSLSTVDCDDTSIRVVGVVRGLGQRFVLVEDTASRAGVPANFYPDLIPELDGKVFPVDSAYFGSTADLDGNQRALVLFTKEVNKLTPMGSAAAVGGFFFNGDLLDPNVPFNQGGCPASNAGELLYLRAPDPNMLFGPKFTVQDAQRNARNVVPHEFQHLIEAEQRFVLGAAPNLFTEDVWLNEGMAHMAEEVAGHNVMGTGTRQDFNLAELIVSNETFEQFVAIQLNNFLRLNEFFESPETTQTLATSNPSLNESLKTRGWAWIFLRWLADQFAPAGPPGIIPGSGEQAIFRELTRGGPSNTLTGVANILNALGTVAVNKTWDDLLAEFASMPGLDDNAPAGAPALTQLTTWDLRAIFLDLFQGTTIRFTGENPVKQAYPLSQRLVALSSTTDETVSFSLRGGAQKYFLLQGASPPDIVVEVTNPTGGTLLAAARAQVTIVRSQ